MGRYHETVKGGKRFGNIGKTDVCSIDQEIFYLILDLVVFVDYLLITEYFGVVFYRLKVTVNIF